MQTLQIAEQTVYFGTSEDMSVIPDAYVDFIITSPPYWNLKDYGDDSQIGHEPYEKYLERLDAVWRECYRVRERICEPWEVPDWSDLDILHASTMVPGMQKPRKAHFQTARLAQLSLISDTQPPTLFSLEEQETL